MSRFKKHRQACLLVAGAMLLGGCAGPKIVNRISTKDSEAKFLYYQQQFLSSKTGIVRCTADDSGTLSECVDKKVVFKD